MKTTFLLLIIVTLTFCSNHFDKEQLPGIYVLNAWGHDTLELKSDGTYYYHTFGTGKILKNNGTWNLNKSGNEVAFENFTFLTNELGPGTWFSRVKQEGSKIQLIYASDIDVYFEKIN